MVLLSVIVESLHISEKKILLNTNCSICFKLAEMLPIQPKNKSHEQKEPYKNEKKQLRKQENKIIKKKSIKILKYLRDRNKYINIKKVKKYIPSRHKVVQCSNIRK